MDEDLGRVLLPFGEAVPLPRRAYVEPGFFELDRALFRASWHPVASEGELASPGSYAVADVAGERVVVVRGADLELAAFLDGCVHRGVLLFPDERGRVEGLSVTCPYHGLRYDLRGRPEPGSAPRVRVAAGAALRPARVASRFGFVFVCVEPSVPELDAWWGETPPWLERASTHALRLGRRVEHAVAANWKLCVDNFQESHHFTQVHPSLEHRTPWKRSTSVDLGGAFLGGTMELADDAETVSDSGELEGRPFVAGPDDRRLIHDALLVPGWLTSLQPDYLLSYRLVPLSEARTRVVSEIYFHAGAFTGSFDPSSVYSFWDRTNAEDRAICELQQRGLASPTFELGPYADVEDGVHAFDRRVAAFYQHALARGAR
ncbi:MAG: aromatic ring-hydroxylating dioxygenase subunit alpha [Polyangiaceae bacterium]|nr:aromatic ring-hydroxylating dioxygenase subunit alpha [Polyangiaceae bacterium]